MKGEPIIYSETDTEYAYGYALLANGPRMVSHRHHRSGPYLIIHICGVVFPATGEVWLCQHRVLSYILGYAEFGSDVVCVLL